MGIVLNSLPVTKTRPHFLFLLLLLLSAPASFAQQFLLHKVGKGETAYAIAKSYSISVDSLYALNPEAKQGLRDGQELRIYNVAQSAADSLDSLAGNFIYHRVQPKETLYALSKKYNVGIQTILQDNPEIIDGLNAGQRIRIPRLPNASVNQAGTSSTKSLTNGTPEKDTKEELTSATRAHAVADVNMSPQSKMNKVALFLPLNLDQVMPWDDTTAVDKGDKSLPTSPALEFYEGFRLAADSLKNMGFRFDLSVYDTRNDTNYIKGLLTNPRLAENDLILGPITAPEMMPVQRYAQEHHIDMAVPCSVAPAFLASSPQLSTTSASVRTQCESMGDYLNKTFAQDQFIFISTGTPKELDLINNFRTKLAASRVRATLTYPKMGTDSLKKCLSKKCRNILVVCSSNESAVNNFLTSIKGLQDSSLFVVGMPTWENFQSLEYTLLQKLQVHLFSTMQVDFTEEKTQRFAAAYRTQYSTEPSASACQGFDMGFYYLQLLGSKGNSWMTHLPEQTYDAMQGRFVFRRIEGGGCENTSITVMRYADKELKIIRK